MSIAKNSTATKIAAVAIGLAMAFSFAAPSAHAQSVEELTAQINSLLSTIASLQSQLAAMTGGGGAAVAAAVCPFAWTQDLTTGAQGPDVRALQRFLNSDPATQVAAAGVGSAGNETDFFGGLTAAAVASFQNVHAAQVLTPVGLTAGTGYFGPSTRAHMNSLCTSAPVTPPADSADDTSDSADDTADSAPAGTGVTVGAGVQPANSIAPNLASRVPFTVFSLTAGADGPVTIDNVTVERTGFADNSVFAGVVLLGPDMEQIGDAKTLNSNNQARVGKDYTIPAGQTHQFTIAGNRANTTTKDGQVASLSVVAINTSATVSGSLPITGASHVVNESLGIGTAEVSVGPSDQNSAQTEEVGVTNELFAAVRVTNNSSDEDIRVMSIRWQQVGSASDDDLDNVRVIVDGVEYPTTRIGDFYTATLGSGVVIAEGFNKEFTLRGDIADGSGRNVQFHIDEDTDIYILGETFGFGITPTQTQNGTDATGSSQMTAGTPFYSGSQFSISAGSFTSFAKSNDVPAQNIAINVPNQPLGAFETDIKGEPISVQSMIFNFVMVGGANGSDLTNVTLVDDNGAVIAGPSDGVAVGGSAGTVTFSDTVTLPVGKNTLSLQGKLSTDFGNDDTIVASTSPANGAGLWTGIEGEETGDTITSLPGTATGNTMTVKAAVVDAKVATDPSAKSIVAGVSGVHVSTIQLDATQSGEDVRFTTAVLDYTNAVGGDPTNCRLYEGTTLLNDDAVNPTAAGPYTFSLDQNVIATKGTIKNLDVKCDVSGSVATNSTFNWGVDHTGDTWNGTGVDSGNTVDALSDAAFDNAGPLMTVTGAGTLLVTLDPSSPSYALAAAGTSDVTLAVLKVAGTNEDIRLDRLALQLSNTTASSSPGNLSSVGIYHGSTHVGSAVFSGSSRNATSTLTETVIVPKDDDIQLTIKGTLAEIGTSKPGTQGALVQVDYDNDDSTGTRGVGQDSGATIDRTSNADSATEGVRVFRSFPIFAKIAVPTSNLVSGDNTFYRFSVTADSADDLGIYKFTFQMATSSSGLTAITAANIFAYTDSGFSTPVSGVRSDGALRQTDLDLTALAGTDVDVIVQNGSGVVTPLQLPSATTRYFEIRGTATGVSTNGSVSTTLRGDAAFPILGGSLMGSSTSIQADPNNDFIWSPNATTTSGINHVDWTNGFGIVGLPATNMTADVLEDN